MGGWKRVLPREKGAGQQWGGRAARGAAAGEWVVVFRPLCATRAHLHALSCLA